MIKQYLLEVKKMRDFYGYRALLSALLGAFVFSTLAFLPLLIILVEVTSLFLHFISFMSVIITGTLGLYVFVMNRLFIKALKLKKQDSDVDYKFLFLVHTVLGEIIVFIAGLVFLIWLMPLWF